MKSEKKKKKELTMAEVTKGYEDFIKGKQTTNTTKKEFENSIKEALKPHVSK